MGRKKIRDRVDKLMDMMGLDPEIFLKRYPLKLSGGQRHRIRVARAIAADPPYYSYRRALWGFRAHYERTNTKRIS